MSDISNTPQSQAPGQVPGGADVAPPREVGETAHSGTLADPHTAQSAPRALGSALDRVHDVADRLREPGPQGAGPVLDGWTADERERLVALWFADLDADELAAREPSVLAEVIRAHLDLGWQRGAGRTLTRLVQPGLAADGWTDRGRALLLVVTDDRPFLVDSISMAISAHEWDIHELLHPQVNVRRDASGRLESMGERTASTVGGAESWIVAEITPPLGRSFDEKRDDLQRAIDDRLVDVQRATDDFQPMLRALGRAEDEVESAPRPDAERAEVREFLQWLRQGNFTLLGHQEFDIDPDTGAFTPVAGTGLGILREQGGADGSTHLSHPVERFDAVPPRDEPADLFVLTKDSVRSTVHRPSWLDYVGIRRFDARGRVVGERRFLGLIGSNGYTESVWRVPVIREKAADVVRRTGHLTGSHSAAQVRAIIDTYPRDELFHATSSELYRVVEAISRLRERRQLRLFVRRGRWGRFVSCVVYFPRDRYNTRVREQMTELLRTAWAAESIEYQAMLGESVLARLFFYLRLPDGGERREVDVAALEQRLADVATSWDDRFVELVGDMPTALRGVTYSEGYKDQFPPSEGVADLMALNQVAGRDDIAFRVRTPEADDPSDLRLVMLRIGAHMQLSDVMPHFGSLGVRVVDEWPYDIELRGEPAVLYDFGVAFPDGVDVAGLVDADTHRVTDAFVASYRGRVPADEFNQLVVRAGLTWRQVALLRAIAGYLQQLRSSYSQSYMARALVAHPEIAASLVHAFEVRFDPALTVDAAGREELFEQQCEAITRALDAVDSLDHDRIVRQFLAVLRASDRTNWFASPSPLDDPATALALKVRPRDIEFAPEPRPLHEIWVHGPLVQGLHLRFGAVARGGLRWSDRPEDFRTEVLGLVKAQMVKNSVIVPVGAKGGFVPQHLPDPAVDRAAWMAAGIEAYRCFVRALLSVTDNIDASGAVVAPEQVVRHDADDPYLVVAADKGTATFSDIANQEAIDHGFWLGDAFASGGSEGYDHKAMGITARGAWESVKRHFRDMGVDCQGTDFTCVGIGDMAGDVFGNGMLLSRHTRLVAAFNHMHIFLDPNPDAEASFGERERLFHLPRSTWDDYDRALISTGGGVHSRSAKSIAITPEVREALGLPATTTAMTPNQLVTAILTAPVDLLWNGGIGTYVKATTESHADVGDKANDAVRVNGRQLRAKVVGEGGNLGFTQRGRIEYAQNGGRLNTDFIDNSAGVDTSDHEVNIKILLASEMASGRLTEQERNELLPTMTDEVARLVLAHNVDQNDALSDALASAERSAGVHEMWMERLEQAGYLDRNLEVMPSSAEMARRIASGTGLTNPELATLLSWTKIWMSDQVLASDLPDDPFVADRLISYFPKELQRRYREEMPQHRLHREIITTVAVNRYVHSQGIAAYHRRSEVTGATPAQVIRAQLAARTILAAARIERLAASDEVSASARTTIREQVRHMVDHACRLLLRGGGALDIRTTIERYQEPVEQVYELLPGVLDADARAAHDRAVERLQAAGVGDELTRRVARGPVAHEALSIVDIATRTGSNVAQVAAVWYQLVDQLQLRRLGRRVDALPRDSRWQIMARAASQDELYAITEHLVGEVVRSASSDGLVPASEVVQRWLAGRPGLAVVRSMLQTVSEDADLAQVSVAVRTVRTLA